ncbi:MAG: DUF4347 domain-containing protein, partial [Burkholderiaceae bacterium]
MNHIFRTVWNEITRSFSAVAETARGKGKSASSKRGADASAAALEAGGVMLGGCAPAAPPRRRRLAGFGARPLALEQRFMFDGAAVSDVFHAIDAGAEAFKTGSENGGATIQSTPGEGRAPAIDTAPSIAAHSVAAPSVAAPAALRLAEANPAANRGRTEIIFIEDNVADYRTLIAAAKPGAEIVLLDSSANGLEQMARYVAGRADVDAIHLFSHGAQAQLNLGALTLTADNLGQYGAPLDSIGRSLTENGDFLVYGCDAAGGDKGLDFIGKLAAATGADVAASDNPTGAAARNGDWNLEVTTGAIETAGEHPLAYSGLLATGQAGQVDTAFGTEAKAGVAGAEGVANVYAGETYVYQSGANAGKVLTVAGLNGNAIVSRFNANGTADTSFNSTGRVSLSFHSSSTGSFISVDGNGKIVIGGNDFDGNATIGVARLNSDGTFDTTFSSDGKAYFDLDGTSFSGGSNYATGMSIQSDNKIVLVGSSFGDKSVIARITTDGVLDTTFSGDGLVINDFSTANGGYEHFFGVVASGTSIYAVGGDSATTLKMLKIKQSDGSLDTSFGTGGIYSLNVGGYGDGSAPIIQSDGKIVISSASQYGGASEKSATLFRLTTAGVLDTTFGTSGFFVQHLGSTGLSDDMIKTTQLSDGKIALSAINNNDGIEVVRLTGAGVIDTGFGVLGTKHIEFPHTSLKTGAGVSLAGSATGDLYVFATDVQGAAKNTSGALLKLFGAEQTGAMTYSFATTMQYSGPISREYTRDVIGVVVGTNGEAAPIGASSFSFNLTGTTALADIANAKLYYTGEHAWLDTSTQIGSTVTGVNGTFTFVGAQSLTTEFNVFWLAVKTGSAATPGNMVDGQLTALTVNAVARTPVVANPYGSKRIFDQLVARIIWTDDMNSAETRTIQPDGSGFLPIFPYVDQYFSGIAIDVANDNIYAIRSDGKLLIANLDGSAKHVIANIGFTTNGLVPNGIAVAPDYLGSGRIFYGTTAAGSNAIVRANLDGSGATTIVSGLGALVQTMEVDTVHNTLYWIELELASSNGSLKMANLDGSGVQTLQTFSNAEMVTSLALDVANNKLYFASRANYILYQSALNGSATTVFADFSVGNNAPVEMALDAAAGQLYWTDANNYQLYATSLAAPATPTVIAFVDDYGSSAAAGQGIVFKAANLAPPDPIGAPAITSATYDASTNILTVTGANMTAGDSIDETLLTITGQGGASYTLTESGAITAASATGFSVTLNATDQINVEGLLNNNGTASATGPTTFNLAAAANWDSSRTTAADLTGNAVTVSNVQTPTISSATYDAGTGVLTVTGTNMVKQAGNANDIDLTKLSFAGQGGTFALTGNTTNVEITSTTSFTVTLGATDKTALNAKLDKNGTSSSGATTYNLVAADDWNGPITGASIADLTGNAVTVSNVPVPAITSATYDATSGLLTVTGSNMTTGDSIDLSKLTLLGEGSATLALTTANVTASSATAFSATLNTADRAALGLFLNKNGTNSTSGTTFNLAAADDWDASVTAGNSADATNAVTVSNVAAPTITSAAYNMASGVLTVTGTGFLHKSGLNNDIDISKLSFSGDSTSYALTNASTANVDIASSTSFTVTLGAADKLAVATRLNKNGTSSSGSVAYNLAAAEDWATGADNAVTVADTSGNGVTVSGISPTVTLAVNNASIAEAAGVATVTATLSATATTDTIVTLGASGTATGAGTDYTLSSTTITIAAGALSGSATITAAQDALDEPGETVIVAITAVSGGDGATESGAQQVTTTITDDDPTPTLSVGAVSIVEGNSGSSNATFTVTLSAASGQAVSVDYATSNGTATAGSDYTTASGTLHFAAGETSKTFTVAVSGDTTNEGDETFGVTLSDATNATIASAVATGTITNDDAVPSLSVGAVSIVEGNSGSSNA